MGSRTPPTSDVVGGRDTGPGPDREDSGLLAMPAKRAHRMVDQHDAVMSAVERWCSGLGNDVFARDSHICGVMRHVDRAPLQLPCPQRRFCVCEAEMKVSVRPHGRYCKLIADELWGSTLVPKLASVRSREGGSPACGGGTLPLATRHERVDQPFPRAFFFRVVRCDLACVFHPLSKKFGRSLSRGSFQRGIAW